MKRVETKYAYRTFDSLCVKLNGFLHRMLVGSSLQLGEGEDATKIFASSAGFPR